MYGGITPNYKIPYMVNGDIMEGSIERYIATILDNQLQLGAMAGPFVAQEGIYTSTVNPDYSVTVNLTGNPAIRGCIANAYLKVNGAISWVVPLGATAYLYLQAGSNIIQDPTNISPTTSPTVLVNNTNLLLAYVDNTTQSSPVLNTAPTNKPILLNLNTLLNSPNNPFGATLVQSNIIVNNSLLVVLSLNQSAVIVATPTSTTPPIVINYTGTAPTIKSTGELKLADKRVTGGLPLTDTSNTTLPNQTTSILGGIQKAWINPATGLGPSNGLTDDGTNINTDASKGNVFGFTLVGSRTLKNPTNATDGQRVVWRPRQDTTGSRILTYDTQFRFGTTVTSGTLTTTPNKTDYIEAMYNAVSTTWDVIRFVASY